ncbi:class E sortase [Streptomyces sp. BI20]|uniref:class E sortase n=1 Tax=Streptomyces sp. BI20 TaxID=3403460 RepID=UPI003C75451E
MRDRIPVVVHGRGRGGRGRGRWGRRRSGPAAVLWVGAELATTLGVVVMLLVVHQLWWTNRQAAAGARDRVAAMEREWAAGGALPGAGATDGSDGAGGPGGAGGSDGSGGSASASEGPEPDPRVGTDEDGDGDGDGSAGVRTPGAGGSGGGGATRRPGSGTAGGGSGTGSGTGSGSGSGTRGPAAPPSGTFAVLRIPRLGIAVPVAEGVGKTAVLDKGFAGHYPGTAGPGEAGNFALAGHRNTHGEPFRYVNRLRAGDELQVDVRGRRYVYVVDRILTQTTPRDVSVVAPVPASSVHPGQGYTAPGSYITLTTCTPEFSSTYRLVVWGKLRG